MSRVFLIAGMGADCRIYNKIELSGHDVSCVDWIEPYPTDTLSTYAQKVIHQYDIRPKSVVIGNSLGGMLAIEIGKIIPLKKVILISSIKTSDEAPAYFSFFRAFPVYKLIPGSFFKRMKIFIRPIFGHMKPEEAWLFADMLVKSSSVFLKWSMKAVLAWRNQVVPPNTFVITGDEDLVFNYRRMNNPVIVKGGTHIMLFEKAKEINKILKTILN